MKKIEDLSSASFKVFTSDLKKTLSKKLLLSASDLYCRIWLEDPWNEDFWTIENASDEILSYQGHSKGVLILALSQNEVIGFTSGWEIDQNELNRRVGRSAFSENKFFYVSELGIDVEARGLGLGRKLTEHLINHIESNDYPKYMALRTDLVALAARALYKKVGFVDLNLCDVDHPTRTYWIR